MSAPDGAGPGPGTPPAEGEAIRIEGLRKSFGPNEVLRGIDLSVATHEVICLIGASGSGKSTLAREVFGAANVVSSDALRELISGDAGDQGATREAFDLLDRIVAARCKRHLVTAVDSTALRPEHRARLQWLAADYGVPCVAVAMNTPLRICLARQDGRERQVPDYIIREQEAAYCRALPELPFEGFAAVTAIDGTRSLDSQADELAEFLARHGSGTERP